jgi:UDP-N-acetylglucosamine 2-epimerase (non-hydrolysing)
LDEGIKPETVIKTGTPMREVLDFYHEKISSSDVLSRLNLARKEFFIVSAHREENIDNPQNFESMLSALDAISERYGKRIIVSTHPRTRKKLEALGKSVQSKIEFMKPLGFFDYVKLQQESYCVISDSGTITEESSILKFPAIMIRQAHERPEGMDVGAVVMSGLSPERVIDSIEIAVRYGNENSYREIEDYKPNAMSKHVVKVIQSYTDYVNRTVWRK